MKKPQILISLAVHENVEVVLDQIENINTFLDSVNVVIHVSKGMGEESKNKLIKKTSDKLNVHINPSSAYTGYLDGSVLISHLLNIKLALDTRITYDYLYLLGSNELFVKKDVAMMMKDYECTDSWVRSSESPFDDGFLRAEKDPYLASLVKKYGLTLRKRAPEGTFYSNPTINSSPILELLGAIEFKIYLLFYTNFWLAKLRKRVLTPLARLFHKLKIPNVVSPFSYATEEFYIPTILSSKVNSKKTVASTCFMDWKNNLCVTKDQIDEIRSGKIKGKFSVKRIERKMSDSLREYIRGLPND